MYEHRAEPLLPRPRFVRRLLLHALAAAGLVVVSLAIGVFGYHGLAKQSWIDSFLNAAMLLGGMGPVGDIPNNAGKVFAGLYALFAGLVLIAVTTVLLVPVFHRILHTVHLEEDEGDEAGAG